jgi:hypothetical protein
MLDLQGEKPEETVKDPCSKGQNQQQTQLTCDAASGNRIRLIVVTSHRHPLPSSGTQG